MIKMSSLKESFEGLGFAEVATYINSGNVIFRTKESDARKLETKIEKMLLQEYQLDSRVVVRTLPEMAKLVKSLPASWNSDSEWRYNVMFLRHPIDSERIVDELPANSDIEQFAYRPGVLLWSAIATDLNSTNLAKLSSKKVFREMTVRNLNTTKKLYDLMSKLETT